MNHAAIAPLSPVPAELPRIYRFGSPQLDDLHRQAWRTVVDYRLGYPVRGRVIDWAFDGFQYVVDHGSFRTLNTMRAGQHAVQIEEIEPAATA